MKMFWQDLKSSVIIGSVLFVCALTIFSVYSCDAANEKIPTFSTVKVVPVLESVKRYADLTNEIYLIISEDEGSYNKIIQALKDADLTDIADKMTEVHSKILKAGEFSEVYSERVQPALADVIDSMSEKEKMSVLQLGLLAWEVGSEHFLDW